MQLLFYKEKTGVFFLKVSIIIIVEIVNGYGNLKYPWYSSTPLAGTPLLNMVLWCVLRMYNDGDKKEKIALITRMDWTTEIQWWVKYYYSEIGGH